MGFEPTTPGLRVRDPSDEPATQAAPAGTRARVPIDEASLDDLPEKQVIGLSIRGCWSDEPSAGYPTVPW